ncbi:MAG: alginate lyase family protein [candidate division Zixibacteria bacterium]|nr:alginate lyase family protein [candidate division Zixibacteria bacterium]
MIQTDRLSWLRKAFSYPPHVAARKLIVKLQAKGTDRKRRARDLASCPRLTETITPAIASLMDISRLDCSGIRKETADYLINMYLDHRFDLLGSGWVQNSYGNRAVGVEGYRYDDSPEIAEFDRDGNWLKEILAPAHLERSQAIWQKIHEPYEPIDWQKDCKSGYRWDVASWYKDQWVDHPGVDIKLPWETARLHHLPQMAIFAKVCPQHRSDILRECRNQILDFIAANPPRMGVNWTCTMDVAIRAVNILLAYDVGRQLDDSGRYFDYALNKIIADSLYEHGRHIVHNLEWSEQLANNHYLADLTGLLSIARYLPRTTETDCWRAFVVQELIREMERQFYPDGGNFESSSSYHRLSTEMMTFATALVIGMNRYDRKALTEYNPRLWTVDPPLKPPDEQEYDSISDHVFPEWYLERLFRAGRLTMYLTRPSGDVAQIGDNDSGRLYRLTPVGDFLDMANALKKYENLKGLQLPESTYWDTDDCCQVPLLSALAGLFSDPDLAMVGDEFPLEQGLIAALAGGTTIDDMARSDDNPPECETYDYDSLPYREETTFASDCQSRYALTDGLSHRAFPDSGIYIFWSRRLHLTICATPVGQNGLGGHSHNDKLSFSLHLDGKSRVDDPGTYLYTALPERRNEFRGIHAHNTIVVDECEQNRWREGRDGLFAMNDETDCDLLELTEKSITLRERYRNVIHVRRFEISRDAIAVIDYCNYPFTVNYDDYEFFSAGYGKLERRF